MTPKYTVLVSTYASSRFLPGCLDALVAQTEADRMEVLVLDSGSPESESDIVRRYQERHPGIVLVRTRREPLYAAWNRGWQMARGEYVIPCNTDDRLAPHALAVLGAALDADPSVDLAYGDVRVTREENETWERNSSYRTYRFHDFFAPSVLLYYQFGPNPMWRRAASARTGFFDETYRRIGDFAFNVTFNLAARARRVPQAVALFADRPAALSYRKEESPTEDDRLFATFRTAPHVFALYAREGVPLDTAEDRAECLLDMAVRASAWYHSIVPGGARCELPFALDCLSWAAAEAPGELRIAVHQLLLVALAGRDVSAMVRSLACRDDVRRQPELLRAIAWAASPPREVSFDEVPWPASRLGLPSEAALAGRSRP